MRAIFLKTKPFAVLFVIVSIMAIFSNARSLTCYGILGTSLITHSLGYFEASEELFRKIPVRAADLAITVASIRSAFVSPVDALNPSWDDAIAHVYGSDSEQMARRFLQKGDIYRKCLANPERAQLCYEKSMAIYSQIPSSKSPTLADSAKVCTLLAMQYADQGRFLSAQELAQQALGKIDMLTVDQFRQAKLDFLQPGLDSVAAATNDKRLAQKVFVLMCKLSHRSNSHNEATPIGLLNS